MTILSRELLSPIRYNIQDPFFSIIDTMETWLKNNQPEYLATKWPEVRYGYMQRALGLAKNGSALRGYARTAPTDELASTMLEIYSLLDHSAYFTSKYWRAFFYWLKTTKLGTCWPQFGKREISLALSVLTKEDLDVLKVKASQEWLDFFADDTAVIKLFHMITQPIQNLCAKRIRFLTQYDPALYSYQDLYQLTYEKVLVSIRKNDYITANPTKMVGWALKCADNAIHNLRDKALVQKRNTKLLNPKLDPNSPYREPKKQIYTMDTHDSKELESITDLIGIDSFEKDIEDNLCLQKLLKFANPKINCYLRTICNGEHNSDFWTWFYYNEPTLAQRPAYLAENPEAIGPYLQRHLNLSTYQLTDFLRQHLPTLLEQVSDTHSNRKKLAYVVGG